MSERYPGGFITKSPPALNPALGNAAPGIWTMDQVMQAVKNGTWPAYDPYFEYTTLLLHGNGTNGAQNNTFLDASTNNFTITRNGNTTQGTFSPYGSNWSNYFDGTSDYLTVPASSSWLFTGDACLEAWVFWTVSQGSIIFATGNASSTDQFGLFPGGEGIWWGGQPNTTTVPTLNAWNHVVATRSGSQIRMFLNGVLTGLVTNGSNIGSNSATAYIGQRPSGGVNFNGNISQLRIINGSIPTVYQTSSTTIGTAVFTPPTAPLTTTSQGATAGDVKLLMCQSNRFIDNSSNAFTITRNGDVSVQRFSPFAPTAAYSAATIGGSGYFDGSGDYLSIADQTQFAFGTADWCMEGWVYATYFPTYARLFGQGLEGGSGATSVSLFMVNGSGTSNATAVNVRTGIGGSISDYNGPSLTLNQWYHIAVYRLSGTIYLAVNGTVYTARTTAGSMDNPTDPWRIGASSNASPSEFWQGYIAGHRLITGNGNVPYGTSNFTPPTTPPTAVTGTQILASMTNAGIIDNAMMNDLETVGNAQISTSVKKYGTGSLAFDGTGDWLAAPSSPNLAFGTGPYTIEFWLYSTTSSGERGVLQTQTASLYGVSVFLDGTTIYIDERTNTYSGSDPRISGSITQNAWVHVAICRQTGTSGTLRAFVNGTQIGSSVTSNLRDLTSTGPVFVGTTAVAANPLNGYIDDLRITKGYARYTANFTPPTSQLQDQ